MRRKAAPMAAMLAGLAGAGLCGCAESVRGYGVRYVGPLPGCDLATVTLARKGTQFAFSPGDGALVIAGAIGADGRFTATLNTAQPGRPDFLLQVSGRFAGAQAEVKYVTPRCTATGTLALVHPPLL
jgi:hypothetical protein